MRKLMTIILCSLAAIAASGQSSEAKEYLVVTHADATSEQFELTDIYNITFSASGTTLYVNFNESAPRSIAVNTDDSYTFFTEEPQEEKLHNEYVYYAYDTPENVLTHLKITGVQLKKGSDGMWAFNFTDEVNSSVSTNVYVSPQLKIAASLVNTGALDLAKDLGGRWSIGYKDINLQSHDNDWVCWPDNGSLEVSVDETAGTCHIELEIFNSYTSYNGAGLGNHMALSLAYDGPLTIK